ncbi:response regulator [Xylophilus rhododendri]|uniref:Response regulator n=1 Tax=Xylophilus rhododendri TaxID=2697032 RepID=A0A857JB96_9BURK|nr:response regulator transcription factor [Xylophilus rhododendri]QHJ00484.1 response regulator [Xylophilus rhododendri]
MRILLVEDDEMLAEGVCAGVRQNAWTIDHAADAAAARIALVDHDYDVVLLDIGLPDATGFTVLEAMRKRGDATPVLMLTARSQLSERIKGLDAGADDYLVKPFQFDELGARIRAVLRRSQGTVVPVQRFGAVQIDRGRKLVTREGAAVNLSAHEFATLLALAGRPGHVLSRRQLADAVYGEDDGSDSNTIAVFIHQLRRKLGEDFITTVHGRGYLLAEPAA